MLNAFAFLDGRPHRLDPAGQPEALAHAVWFDLYNASPEETAQVQAATGQEIPNRTAIYEIESSSRLSTRNGVTYVNMPLISMTDGPRGVAVGFALTQRHLVTVRFAPSRSFDTFTEQWTRADIAAEGPAQIFLGLMEAVIDRQADALEGVRADLDNISRRIFNIGATGRGERRDEDRRLRVTLRELGRIGDLISHVRDTQVVAGRIVPYVESTTAEWLPRDTRARLRTLGRDIESVAAFANYLNDKLQFMLDATLGFISIAQNNLMKVMTIASVAGIPPVLVAGIYGMNFHVMPELDWTWGYPWALGLIILSTIIPLAAFRWRGWL